jgi:hypothetical protein
MSSHLTQAPVLLFAFMMASFGATLLFASLQDAMHK